MNERIQELIKQCRWQETVVEDGEEWIHAHFDEHKFAELIVEEMYDFIMEESANDNGIPNLGKVKEHFGVEE